MFYTDETDYTSMPNGTEKHASNRPSKNIMEKMALFLNEQKFLLNNSQQRTRRWRKHQGKVILQVAVHSK